MTFDVVPDFEYNKSKAISIETVRVKKSRSNGKGQLKTHKVKVYSSGHALVLKRSKEKALARK